MATLAGQRRAVHAPTTAPLWPLLLAIASLAWLPFVIGRSGSRAFGLVYGALVASWLLLQTIFAEAEHRRQARVPRTRRSEALTVVIPTYRETADAVIAGIRSILAQDYDGRIDVIVVDDGSPGDPLDLSELDACCGPQRTLLYHKLPENRGKRHAQSWGFERATGEYVVTVDSDAVLEPDAIGRAMDSFDGDDVGAVTGVAYVSNRVNLLTRLLQLRYWAAFHQERAAQSLFGVMICCAGVFSIYRRDLVQQLLDRYLAQRFLGRPCHYGDDRHLTNLILWEGYRTRVALDAVVWTASPSSLRKWLKQQQRWSKSFYREFLWSARFAHQQNWYFAYCLVFQAVLPVLFLYGVLRGAAHCLGGDPMVGLRYLASVAIMAWLRGLYGLSRTRDPWFLMMPAYGLIHLVCVFPIRLFAFATLWDNRWGTR